MTGGLTTRHDLIWNVQYFMGMVLTYTFTFRYITTQRENSMKFITSYIAVFAASFLLYGCGDTVQSASGSGTIINGGEDAEMHETINEAAIPVIEEEATEFTEDNPNCSVESREAGDC